MYSKRILLLLLICPLFVLAQPAINIIPKPVKLVLRSGYFTIDGNTVIQFKGSNHALQLNADFLAASVKNISGVKLSLNTDDEKVIGLTIAKIDGIGEEGYQLNVSESTISLKANSAKGIFYGIQSLLQTLPQVRTNAQLQVPCMDITDYPRFGWRGLHLDVSRHFFPTTMVKEYIDLMAMYKLNVFHWHLTDDQGWRIEIKKYPKLTQTGAWRVERPGKNWGDCEPAKPGEAAEYGGFYTQNEIKEIVEYARQRNITVLPEIEMPGHSSAALAAYPQFSCSQQPQFVVTGGQYPKGIQSNYCVGNDSSFLFLEDVLKEVMQLFPSQYIHVGGDEVDKADWKQCVKCQARKKAEGLKDENELQSYLIRRIEKFLIANNRKLIGWDEILEGGLAPEAAVMSWRGESGGIAAAKMKHEVVMTPGSPCYFDHYQAGPEGEPLAIGGFNTLKKVYAYEPIPAELSADEGKYVLGAQANVWTEFITDNESLEYMILPRMPALAEVLWTPKNKKDFTDFNKRLQYHFKAYGQKGLHYCKGNFTVEIRPESVNGKLQVALLSDALNSDIYYTTNGNNPTVLDKKYNQPVLIDSSVILKAVSVVNGNIMGVKPSEQSFVMHKAIARDVVYTNPASKYYTAEGPNTLTDGIRGNRSHAKNWHGFDGKDMVATIDLGAETSMQAISLGCLQNYGAWIFFPKSIVFETSTDGKTFTETATLVNTVSVNEKAVMIKDFSVNFPSLTARYVRVIAKNLGVCPEGHEGAGQPAWLFADELIVK